MKTQILALACTLALALASLTFGAAAQTTLSAKAQYTVDSKAAKSRYDSDLKLCADETSSSARLQCRRDAKTEYDKALTEAKARMSAPAPVATPVAAPAPAPVSQTICPDCGKVVSVSVTEKQGEGGAIGIIGGGAAGALLGQQVGQGAGKDLATIAGAIGGAYAGKKIEEKVRTHKVWSVHVQYGDGSRRSFEFSQDPGLIVGDKVRNSGDSIIRD